jgi:hypothetical protein
MIDGLVIPVGLVPHECHGCASQRVRAVSLVLPKDVPFYEGAREALVARPGVYVASA